MNRKRQSGIASLVAAMLLVSGVLVVLLLTTDVIRTRAVDTARSSDSNAAFLIAESGLERAQLVISNAVTGAVTSDSTCSGFLTDGPFSIGRGTLSYTQADSQPPNCGTTTVCSSCKLTAKGVVGSTERDLSLDVEYGTQDGVTGRGTTVKMALKNTFSTDAIALFNLAWRRQGQGGNASSTLTTCATCTLMWNLNSSSGQKSAGGMGTAVPISANTYSQIVTQTLDYSRDFTEVGGLFPGVSSAPTRLFAYWSDGTEGAGATYQTFANNATTVTGKVLAGVASSSTSSCVTPTGANGMNPPGNNGDYQSQSCTSWCYGGDTLIMGLSAGSTTVANNTTAVQFDTAGSNNDMSFLVHYPNTDGTTANASGAEYAEIWYLYNPPYNSSSDPANSSFSGAGATSYTAAVIGAAGATLSFPNSSKIGNNQQTGTFTSATGYQACVGDTIVDSNLPSGTTITSLKLHTTGTPQTCVSAGTGLNIDITVSQKATGNVTSPNVRSTSLHVSATTADLAAGSATVLASGSTITIASGPVSGVYTLSTAATVASGYIVQGDGLSKTIKVASASDLPSTTGITWLDAQPTPQTHNTVYRVYSIASGGTGVLAANTNVSAVDTTNKSFTISAAPSTPLVGATLCAGTCAYFNTPNSASTVTAFKITPTSGITQWSIGFMCLKNVDPQKIQKVTSTAITSRNWSEAVQ
jgi:hypothetical protein